MEDFKHLTDLIEQFRNDRDWKQFHTPKDVAMDIVIEAGEVLEHFQWKSDREITEYVKKHKEEIGDELSDVLHGVLLMALELDIDLVDAFEKKMKKNEQKYPVKKVKGRNVKYTAL